MMSFEITLVNWHISLLMFAIAIGIVLAVRHLLKDDDE